MNALILHAHPDDELLWAGALMAARPDWTWTTVSLTGGARAYPGVTLGHPDEWRLLSLAEARGWRDSVADLGLNPDVTITHNKMGEYGHPHHMAVHRIAHDLYDPVWDFYDLSDTAVGSQQARSAIDFVTVDTDKEARFVATYGQSVLDELRTDHPEMVGLLFREEWFTGPGLLPC